MRGLARRYCCFRRDATAGKRTLEFDQFVAPGIIFGSGNENGAFTTHRRRGIEVGLRVKQRFSPANVFNSNGNGTYSFPAGNNHSVAPGDVAANAAGYEDFLNTYNVAQNSWNYEFFNTLGTSLADFDPAVDGNYVVYLRVKDPGRGRILAESRIQVLVGDWKPLGHGDDDEDDEDSDEVDEDDEDS